MKKLLLLFLLFPVLDSYAQKWEKNYEFVDNCICGLSKVKKDGKIGYVNKEGVEIIKPKYNEGLTFNEGYTAVRMESNWQYFDSTGKAITDAVYEDAMSFKNGLAAVAKSSLYGYINTSGEVVITFQFSNARSFSEGLAPAANAKGYWGFIDTKGEWVVKPAYDFTGEFENGEARVIKGDKVFYIDRQNKVIRQ
ncbi:MAG: WG repeat-containing protein [Chitinophagaceae bacterium]|nr:WG repeat-containing protein [Chitinophagaceae bacterium]